MTMISIDGRQNSTGLVSVSGLARRLGQDEQALIATMKRGKVPLQPNAGQAWAPVSHAKVQQLLAGAGIGELHLYTADAAARTLGVRPSAVRAAVAGQQQLFATALHEPVAELDQLQRIGAVRAQKAASSAVDTGSRAARIAVRVARLSAPYAVGAVPTILLAKHLAGTIGNRFEPADDQRTRRAGMLMGASIIATAGGVGTGAAIAPELPGIAKVARGIGVGGAVLGVLSLGAVSALNHDEAG